MNRPLALPKAMPRRKALVSDHALLRWLERALEIDIEAVRRSILSARVIEAIEAGAERIHLPAERVTLIIGETGTVKTVLPIASGRRGR